ncbi:hypothetical protein GCM10010124_25990 [Pilimelia terevasa]|uniref:Uncharacterized protein n=1 Tax=Pilimelia terevasa TaxID=53372 RepID=A0A8J3FJ32_9ACTN|nr:hypothetical protein [Pilimelia terevasa]GGK32042.1 hypothetical protein GCM10010124_25990 [Pilimelia terevasa]
MSDLKQSRADRITDWALLAILVVIGLFVLSGVVGLWVTVIIPALNAPA